jgi:diguanylate cyclase (GGDEF)-like protein
MDHGLKRTVTLLAGLQSICGLPPEKRMAAIERLLSPLGEILNASIALILWQNKRHPVLLGTGAPLPGGSGGSRGPGNADPGQPARATWWVRWVDPLQAMPTDGVVRRGTLLPEQTSVAAAPPGWGAEAGNTGDLDPATARPVMGVGIKLSGQPVRLIFLREAGDEPFEDVNAELLTGVADHLILFDQVGARLEKLRRETVTDDLTGIFNYRYLKRTLHAALRRIRDQQGGQLSVLMVDVDHLREYNDRYGHLAASAVLARVGRVLGRSMRPPGWVAKYGGDEFLVVLPRAPQEDAMAEAERLRKSVEEAQLGEAPFGGITCSFGVAVAPQDGATYVALLEAADRALFGAKAAGRNTVLGTGDSGDAGTPPVLAA